MKSTGIIKYILFYTFAAMFVISCTNDKSSNTNRDTATDGTKGNCIQQLKYAKFFSIADLSSCDGIKTENSKANQNRTASGVKKLTIKNTWNGEAKDDVYTLVPRDCTKALSGNIYAIPYPVKSVVCMSSSHVAYISELGEEASIKGIGGTRYISNEKVKELIKQGEIIDVGGENTPNYELIMAMQPDVVIAYGIAGSNNSHIERLQKFGIKVLTIGDYLENSPLGKLEYLKLFGELTGKRELADSIFTYKEGQYLDIKTKIAAAINREQSANADYSKKHKPTKVLLNAPYKGTWYIPGKGNYTAQLIQDAGGEILGAKDGSANSAQLSFEQVYQYALQAQVWLHPNSINTLGELSAEHPLFKNIPALKNGKVYNNTLRNTPDGGSDFWETGVVEPHIILQDLAYILNPQLFISAPELKYYQQLK